MRLQLASHVPGADDLAMEGGYRYSKYSVGFDTNTYKIGLDWAPVRDVRLRGSYQRAVRAPNIGELFTPQSVGLDGSVDPCAAPQTPGSATHQWRHARQCKATGVKPSEFGHIVPNSANQYNGLLGGNRNLQPEDGRYLHGRRGAAAALGAEPDAVGRLLQHQDRQRDRHHRRQHHPQRLHRLRDSSARCIHRDANGCLWRTRTATSSIRR